MRLKRQRGGECDAFVRVWRRFRHEADDFANESGDIVEFLRERQTSGKRIADRLLFFDILTQNAGNINSGYSIGKRCFLGLIAPRLFELA